MCRPTQDSIYCLVSNGIDYKSFVDFILVKIILKIVLEFEIKSRNTLVTFVKNKSNEETSTTDVTKSLKLIKIVQKS